MRGEKYIVLDVHQATISVAVVDSQGKLMNLLGNRPSGQAILVNPLISQPGNVHVDQTLITCGVS